MAWLVPDLHGNVAAGLSGDGSSVTDALRYDGYGMTAAVWPTGGSPASSYWKYQGRLDLGPTSTSLYDFAARDYAPGLGTFTGLDSVMGSAQSPTHLNRYLYAAADPTTLVDPDGHAGCDPFTGARCLMPNGDIILPGPDLTGCSAVSCDNGDTIQSMTGVDLPVHVVSPANSIRVPAGQHVDRNLRGGCQDLGCWASIAAVATVVVCPECALAAASRVASASRTLPVRAKLAISGAAIGAGSYTLPIVVANLARHEPVTKDLDPFDFWTSAAAGAITGPLGATKSLAGKAIGLGAKAAIGGSLGFAQSTASMVVHGRTNVMEPVAGTFFGIVGARGPGGPGAIGFGKALVSGTVLNAAQNIVQLFDPLKALRKLLTWSPGPQFMRGIWRHAE